MSKEYLLQLTTETPDRKKIKIDEDIFEIAVPEDFELEEFLKLSEAGREASGLLRADNRSAKEVKEMNELLDLVVKSVLLKLPDEVFEKLKMVQKLAILNAFSSVEEWQEIGGTPRRNPGPNLSPDSKDSTAEVSKTG